MQKGLRFIYIIRCGPFTLSIIPKTFMFFEKKLPKNLEGMKKVRTFASAFALKLRAGAQKKAFFEKTYIKQIIVVQEAGGLWSPG